MYPSQNKDSKIVVVGALLIMLIGGGLIFKKFWNSSSDTNQSVVTGSAPQEKNQISTLSTDIVRQKILNKENVRFLDFRDPESFQQEHIPHSTSLSIGSFSSFIPEKDELLILILPLKDTTMLNTLKGILQKKSYRAFLLDGGFEAWRKGGNQVISYGYLDSLLDQSKVTYITQDEIKNSDLDFIMLDVQATENYMKKHVAGVLHIPLDQIEKRSVEIPATKNIVVYGEDELAAFRGVVRLAGLNIITAKALRGNNHLQPDSIFLLEP